MSKSHSRKKKRESTIDMFKIKNKWLPLNRSLNSMIDYNNSLQFYDYDLNMCMSQHLGSSSLHTLQKEQCHNHEFQLVLDLNQQRTATNLGCLLDSKLFQR